MTTRRPDPDLTAVASPWGIRAGRARPDLCAAGSPERVLSRMVIEDVSGGLWIVEEISPASIPLKERRAEILYRLERAGLPVHPYLRELRGAWVSCEKGRYRMLRPFVEGVPLERPGYALEAWRGRSMGAFLVSLRRAARTLPADLRVPAFSLEAFIRELFRRIRHHDPALRPDLHPVMQRLEGRLFPVLESLPQTFCHGDFHPLNVIWSQDGVRSVIDWEFCGLKTEAFDAALLTGCIGMEHPRSLRGPFVPALLGEIRREGILSPGSLSFLFELVLAVRLLWLSEWLRGRDMEMVRLEVDYLDLLLAEESILRQVWELPR